MGLCTIVFVGMDTTTVTSWLHFKLGSHHMLELKFVSHLNIPVLISKMQEIQRSRNLEPHYSLPQIQVCANPQAMLPHVKLSALISMQSNYMVSTMQTSQPRSLLKRLLSAARQYRICRLLNCTLETELQSHRWESTYHFGQLSSLCSSK